jgi:diketogulonate reductase-like aldo/keto reductase
MPQLGYGVWQISDSEAATAVATALDEGYRTIDTASIYQNEEGTGRGIAACRIPREELFVTTKLWNSSSLSWTRELVLREFDASLSRLGLDYLDLYLIHWPRPMRDDYLIIWRAFEEIFGSGRSKAIGVCNFQPAHLRRLLEHAEIVPAVNQIELHPYFQQAELRSLHAELGITTEAYSPLARGSGTYSPLGEGKGLLNDPALVKIAAKHGRTPAQVVLRWHLRIGNVAIPKSVTPSRIRENIDVFDFELDDEDLSAITALDTSTRLDEDPDAFDWS